MKSSNWQKLRRHVEPAEPYTSFDWAANTPRPSKPYLTT